MWTNHLPHLFSEAFGLYMEDDHSQALHHMIAKEKIKDMKGNKTPKHNMLFKMSQHHCHTVHSG